MRSADYLLIGGGVASVRAAGRIRELDSKGRILLVGEEPHLPYDRPPLSKELARGEVKPAEIVCRKRLFYRKKRIRLKRGVRVEKLELNGGAGSRFPHTAHLSDGKRVSFRKALLATGGTPRRLQRVRGHNLAGVYVLRNVEHSEHIAARAMPGRRALVIGAGFIGLELAASLRSRGCEVTVVEQEPRVWSAFAPTELGDYMERYLHEKGIRFVKGTTVTAFHGTGQVSSADLASGESLPCDFACVCVGITPRVELAEQAGVRVDDGVVVNEKMQSSHPDIFAAGDIANFPDPYFESRRRVEHFGQAEYTGLLAGEGMTVGDMSYDLLTYVWSDIFDLHIEFAGNEHAHDETVIRGSLEDKEALILYLKDGRIAAYFGLNAQEAVFGPLQLLIKRRVDVSGAREQLSDPGFPLPKLLEGAVT